MLSALYIVSRDGRPIYYYVSDDSTDNQDEISDVTLFSGILSAIQGVMREIDAGEISSFNTEKNKIFIKNHETVAYVFLVPLSSNYSQLDIDSFFNKLSENLPLDFSNPNISRTKSEDNMLNTIVKMLYQQWLKEISESKASKKLKEDLW